MSTNRYDIPKDPKEIVTYFDRLGDEAVAARRGRDWRARINLLFVAGSQWFVYDTDRDRFHSVVIDHEDGPPLITVNKVGGIVDRVIAKLTKGSPIPECRPISSDEDDIGAARVGTRIIRSEFDRLRFESLLPELYGWVIPVGWGYLQVYWDPEKGPVVNDKDGTHRGDTCLEIVPHFEIAHNLDAKDVCDARWVRRTTALTPEEVWERYGKEIVPSSTALTLADDLGMMEDHWSASGSRRPSRVLVHQLWIPPGKMRSRPKGLVMTWAGKEILEPAKDFPYDHGKPPFVQFNYLPPKGTPWGRTTVDDLIPMQMDYNDSRSREAAIRQVLIPHIIAPQNSIDEEKVGTQVSVIPYLPLGAKPDILMPDSGWMTQWETGMNRSDSEMGERTGINEAAKGQLTGTSPAATVLAQQEAAAEPLGIPAKELAKSVQETGWQTVMLARQYWDEKRVVRTWSEAGHLETDRFQKADIAEQLDVYVSTESALPRSKAGLANLAMELFSIGTDPQTGKVNFGFTDLVRMLNVPGMDALTIGVNRDTKEAEWSLGEVVRAKSIEDIPPPQPWQDYAEFIRVFNDYRKTAEYRALDDRHKGWIEAIVTVYETLQTSRMGPATMAQSAEGIPPGGDSMQMALPPPTGSAPSPLPVPSTTQLAGMTGGIAGEQGRVPGIEADQQAYLTGN